MKKIENYATHGKEVNSGQRLVDARLMNLNKIRESCNPEMLQAIIDAAVSDIRNEPDKESQKCRLLNERILAAQARLEELTGSGDISFNPNDMNYEEKEKFNV